MMCVKIILLFPFHVTGFIIGFFGRGFLAGLVSGYFYLHKQMMNDFEQAFRQQHAKHQGSDDEILR